MNLCLEVVFIPFTHLALELPLLHALFCLVPMRREPVSERHRIGIKPADKFIRRMAALEIEGGQLTIEVIGVSDPVFNFFVSEALVCKLKRKALKQIAQGSVIRVGELSRLTRFLKLEKRVVLQTLIERVDITLIKSPNGITKRIPIVARVDHSAVTRRIPI